jgi:4-hydroxy-tetrahydrodipicolinate synthase
MKSTSTWPSWTKNLPATIKASLRMTGLEAGDPRLPIFPLGETGRSQLQGLLNSLR